MGQTSETHSRVQAAPIAPSGRPDRPITYVKLRNGTLLVRGMGAGVYDLDGAPHGTLGVHLRFGLALELCAEARPKSPTGASDTPAVFLGDKNVPAPASCPATPH